MPKAVIEVPDWVGSDIIEKLRMFLEKLLERISGDERNVKLNIYKNAEFLIKLNNKNEKDLRRYSFHSSSWVMASTPNARKG